MSKTGTGNRITLLINSLSGGGAERVTCNLANYLFKKGNRVDVITLSNKDDTYELNDGVRRICLLDESEQTNKLHNLWTKWKRLKKYVMEHQNVDCYITMLPISVFMLTRLRKYIKGKVIVSDRANPSSYSKINRYMMDYGVKRCDGLVVQTKEISEWYKDIENKVIIPNAINPDIVFPKNVKVEKKIVAVGRFTKQKNYPMLIEAFSRFSKKHPDFSLELYGKGCEEGNMRVIVSGLGLDKKVKFMGYVKNISENIASATCFAMASNYEGMSNALIEAMCIGLPCVVTDCDGGGASDLIKNMENGILIKKGDVDAMVSGLCQIVEDDSLRRKLSKNAQTLREELNPEKIYEIWSKYVIRVIEVVGEEADGS